MITDPWYISNVLNSISTILDSFEAEIKRQAAEKDIEHSEALEA
jgi:hypothetical protein